MRSGRVDCELIDPKIMYCMCYRNHHSKYPSAACIYFVPATRIRHEWGSRTHRAELAFAFAVRLVQNISRRKHESCESCLVLLLVLSRPYGAK